MIRSEYIQSEENLSMKDSLQKIIIRVITYDVIFLALLRLALVLIPHREQDAIYYVNINFIFIIACLTWMNYKKSKVNKPIVLLFSILYTPYLVLIFLYIFGWTYFSETFGYVLYHTLYIYLSSYQLFITFYIFFLSLYPYKTNKYYLHLSIVLTIVISAIMYTPIFLSTEYTIAYLYPVFIRSYYISLINISLLAVFWHQYIRTKLIFSEYLSSILSIYTISIGLFVLHAFSFENELLFEYFGQFFESLLYLIFSILWMLRLNYLNKSESIENENYIENYYMLQGFIDKPRKGLLITFYSGINKTAFIIVIAVIIFLGVYLFIYDKFEIFIRLNILIFIIAFLISTILAIATWHKRWYNAMGFLFKKKKK